MDDYSALAYRIAGGVADVRGCLILSRDGLILGSYPDDETAVKPAWVRFASLGDPERSFVEFGDQVWVYVRRPAYGAFAVANAGIRPGLVIDQLEGILASAEESRNRRDTLRVPEASGGPAAKPQSSIRPSPNGSSASSAAGPRQRGGPPLVPCHATRRRTVRRRPGEGGARQGRERRRPVGGCDPGRWPHLRSEGRGRRGRRRRPGGRGGGRRSRCRRGRRSGGDRRREGHVRRMPPAHTTARVRTRPLRWSSTPTPRWIRSCWPKSFRGCFRLRAVMTKLVPDDLDRTDAGRPT